MLDILNYGFIQNALIASVLTGLVCGLLGTYVVARRMVFIAGGIAHASLGGVGVCALLGWPIVLGASAFAMLTGACVQRLSRFQEVREDSAIAMLWAFGMSVGVMCAFLSPTFLPNLSSYLFGNILMVSSADLWMLGAVAVLVALAYWVALPQIVAVAFDREFARSQGLPVAAIETVMMIFVALGIVACLRTAGIVMVISLLSIPQMTANLFTRSFGRLCLWSVLLCVVVCLTGLAVSYKMGVPCGPCIIIVAIAIYIVLRTIKAGIRRFNL